MFCSLTAAFIASDRDGCANPSRRNGPPVSGREWSKRRRTCRREAAVCEAEIVMNVGVEGFEVELCTRRMPSAVSTLAAAYLKEKTASLQ